MKLLSSKISRLFRRKKTALFVAFFILSVSAALFYLVKIFQYNKAYTNLYESSDAVSLRKFPYPYKAALTIANDIDATERFEDFLEIQEFLNTKNITTMGEGIGLEIGNSFFMWPIQNEFGYFSTRIADKAILTRFIKAGIIDSLHSWGDGFIDRDSAVIGINELEKHDLALEVWINHAQNPSNLGRWRTQFLGDNKNSEYYHADITIGYGVKFVWLGSSTWVIGQATPIGLGTFFGSCDWRYPLKSGINAFKGLLKHVLSVFGLRHSRYELHGPNELVMPTTLDDGQRAYQFMRYDNHYDGIGLGALANTMHYNLSGRVFRRLIRSRGYAILYTHFAMGTDSSQLITSETKEALRYLAKESEMGNIFVTTTSKLLKYHTIHKYLDWDYVVDNNHVLIRINGVDDPVFGAFLPTPEDLQGITFYVPAEVNVRVLIGEKQVHGIIRNPEDVTYRESVTIPFVRLRYPESISIEK